MAKRRFGKAVLLLGAAFSLAATTAAAQTFTTLYNFCSQLQCADGEAPATPMIQGTDGNLYGTTSAGGTAGQGTVFKITTDARLTTVHTFCTQRPCLDGSGPQALVLATDGNFYGTTSVDGAHGGGTVFRMTPGGNLTTLYSFCSQRYCTDGYSPYAGQVQAADGNLYGTPFRTPSSSRCRRRRRWRRHPPWFRRSFRPSPG